MDNNFDKRMSILQYFTALRPAYQLVFCGHKEFHANPTSFFIS